MDGFDRLVLREPLCDARVQCHRDNTVYKDSKSILLVLVISSNLNTLFSREYHSGTRLFSVITDNRWQLPRIPLCHIKRGSQRLPRYHKRRCVQ